MVSGLRDVRLSTIIIATAVITLLFLPLTVSTNNNASLQSQSVFAQQQQTCLIGGDGSTATGVWQGPKEISPQGIFPAGAPIAMFKQTDNVLTALAVKNNGALSVSWVVGTGVWQGPQEISSQNTFPAGAGIGVFRQTNTVLTALAVKNNGALAVSWVDMGTPPPPARSEVWQGPKEIIPPNTFPAGAPVAMFKQTDNQLIALVTKSNGALAMSWVVGTGVWLGAAEISSPSVFPAETHVAIAKQTDDVLTSLAVENNGALAVSWSDTGLTCPTVLGGIGGGGSGTIEPGNPNPSPGFNTPPPLSPETQRKIEFYKKEICSPGNPPPIVELNCPDTPLCKYGAIKWSIFRTCEEIYPEYYGQTPSIYSPTSNNPVDEFIRMECAAELTLGRYPPVSYSEAIYLCSQDPFSANYFNARSFGQGTITTPCSPNSECKEKFSQFVRMMEELGLPSGILTRVESSEYAFREERLQDTAGVTNPILKSIALQEGTLNSALTPLNWENNGPISVIYHEAAHAYLDIMKDDPLIATVVSHTIQHYTNAPLDDGSTTANPGKLAS
jgi:hypothetical protein